MNNLQLRKQALILESDLNRLTLRTECQNLRLAAGRFARPGRFLNTNWLLAVAPVAGFLAVRWFRRRETPASRWLAAFKWLPPLYSLWRAFNSASSRE